MSSRHRRRRGGQVSDSNYPSQWSEWEWVENNRRWVRYRLSGPDQYEYDYDEPVEEKNQQTALQKESIHPPTPLDSAIDGDRILAKFEFTYLPVSTTTPSIHSDGLAPERTARSSCEWPSCTMSFPNLYERDRHYVTVHSNNAERPYRCEVVNCPASVTSWATAGKLKLHRKNWHGPYQCGHPGCSRGFPNGFGSQAELNIHIGTAHGSTPQPESSSSDRMDLNRSNSIGSNDNTPKSNKISINESTSNTDSGLSGQTPGHSQSGGSGETQVAFTSTPSSLASSTQTPSGSMVVPDISSLSISKAVEPIRARNERTMTEPLDSQFKVHRSREFELGRIFKILWAEPCGSHGSHGTDIESEPETASNNMFSKIRRFLVVKNDRGHSICLSILSYGRQGTLKHGVHAEHHTIIYSESPVILEGELFTKKPIRVELDNPMEKLSSTSRLNYAKVYTVEHNVKVCFIGHVPGRHLDQVARDYNAIHRPLPTSSYFLGIPRFYSEYRSNDSSQGAATTQQSYIPSTTFLTGLSNPSPHQNVAEERAKNLGDPGFQEDLYSAD